MTEAEWLACTDPIRMLDHLGAHCSRRKLRLFVAAGARSLASVLGNDQELLADLHEQVADGQATRDDLEWVLLGGMRGLWLHRAPDGNLPSEWQSARMVVRERYKLSPLQKNEVVTDESRAAEYSEMCRQLRCIFGIPFHSVYLDPISLTRNDLTIASMAESIYAERSFDRLPFLADALEDAGCTDAELLSHLRGPGPHVRGCWAVDLVLGKS